MPANIISPKLVPNECVPASIPLDISAKETIMGCCIHIVRADQAVTNQERVNIKLIKDELGI